MSNNYFDIPVDFCANKRSGLYKKMDDCQSYYYCSHGTTHIKKCFPGTLYNAETKSCDWEANVDCDKQDPDGNYHFIESFYTHPTTSLALTLNTS